MFNLQLLETFKTYIQASKLLNDPPLKDFAQALVTNELGLLAADPTATAAKCVLVDLTVHLRAVLLCGAKDVLAPLQQLALQPANMQVCVFLNGRQIALKWSLMSLCLQTAGGLLAYDGR